MGEQPINPINHWLNFQLRGLRGRVAYRVSEADWERGQDIFRSIGDQPPDSRPAFFVFDTLDNLTVAVATECVEMVRFPYAFGTYEPAPESDGMLRVRFRDRRGIYSAFLEEVDQLADIFFNLELGSEEFIEFLDEDGEAVMLRPESLVLVEAPRDRVHEGHRLIDQEIAGEGDAAEPEPSVAQ